MINVVLMTDTLACWKFLRGIPCKQSDVYDTSAPWITVTDCKLLVILGPEKQRATLSNVPYLPSLWLLYPASNSQSDFCVCVRACISVIWKEMKVT